jgi:hypothetical protein
MMYTYSDASDVKYDRRATWSTRSGPIFERFASFFSYVELSPQTTIIVLPSRLDS